MTVRVRIQPGDGDGRHGSVNGYGNHRCRCQECRAAWAAYFKQKRREGDRGFVSFHGDLCIHAVLRRLADSNRWNRSERHVRVNAPRRLSRCWLLVFLAASVVALALGFFGALGAVE